MKRLFIQVVAVICLAVISMTSYAQINGSFEYLTGTNYRSAFASNQVGGWQQSHGTPSIFGGAPGEGQRSAWMWSYSGRGEGIVQNYSFSPGSVYTVTFWVKTNNPDGNFYVQAANNVPNGTTTSTAFPSVSSKQLIYSAGLVFNNWQQITVTFTPNASYSQLWIYPYLASYPRNGQAEVQIDGINITAYTHCTPMSVAVPNYSFERMSGTNRVRPFSNGQVSGWAQSHGTPSMFGGAPGQGNNSAWMWSYYGRGEGIVTNVNFQAGTTYKVKFWVKTNNPDGNFYVQAANNVPNGTTTSTAFPSVSSKQLIYSAGLVFNNWQQITVTFTPNASYSQLWIYPYLASYPRNGQAEVQIDGINITACTHCTPMSVAIPNYSFERMSGTDRVRPFSNRQVSGWAQSHGTPSMFGGAPGQGNNSAWMWSSCRRGEGIVTNVNFQAGTTYKVKFWVRTSNTVGAFYFKAANGVPSGTTTSVTIPGVSSQQTIFNSGLVFPKWVEKTVTFTANGNYSQLWIYPNGQAELQVDAIRIETVCKSKRRRLIEENPGEEIIDLPVKKDSKAQDELAVKIFPNPITSQVTIELPEITLKANVVIYDLNTGQKIDSFTVTQDRNQWQVPAHVKAGIYQMTVTDPVNQTQKSTRIIVEQK